MDEVLNSPEPPRIKKFRVELAKSIPSFPNNSVTSRELLKKSLGSLLIDYTNWIVRLVVPKPRVIVVESAASDDPRWSQNLPRIQTILKLAETGGDLSPYLSQRAFTRGFTPKAARTGEVSERWADKDMVLNTMGYHHVHLEPLPERSREVLFVEVGREVFTVIGLFDHSVFDTQQDGELSEERQRLWKIHQARSLRGVKPGTIVAFGPTTSGHSMFLGHYASTVARRVYAEDPNLDDKEFQQYCYSKWQLPMPQRVKLEWRMLQLDLGVYDKRKDAFIRMLAGPN